MFGIEDKKLYYITRIVTIIVAFGIMACGIVRMIVETSSLQLL